MSWPPKTPYLATDGIVEIYDESQNFIGVVLIKRKNEPLGLALPGGFVDVGESVESALVREMKEEISLDVEIVRLLGIYSDPLRDIRFHTASAVYICRANGVPIGADDAKEAEILSLEELPLNDLVFDHKKILMDYLQSTNTNK